MLAYLRRYRGETLHVVNNLSAHVQPVELDLRGHAGSAPVEILHQTRFPPVRETPYFLSLGPFLITPDEIGGPEEVRKIRTATRLNGEVQRENVVAHMKHDPYALIAFHSRGMTWLPGDILLTGTPGAVVLKDGDVVGSEVAGVGLLENPVSRS